MPPEPRRRYGPMPQGELVTQTEDVLVDRRGYLYTFEAGEQSGLDGACVQAGGLRPRCRAKLSDWISREVPFAFPRSGCHFGTELGTPKPAVFALDAATSVRRSSLFDPMMRTSFASTSTRRASAEMIATVAAALGLHVGPSITPQALKRFTRRARKRIWRRTAQERRGADRRPREGKIKGAMCARSDDEESRTVQGPGARCVLAP